MVDLDILSARLVPYRLRLIAEAGLGGERIGRLVRLETADGLSAWGDAAPLPGFSKETVEEIDTEWSRIQPEAWEQPWPRFQFEESSAFGSRLRSFTNPSLRFGVEQALAGLTAASGGMAPPQLLAPRAPATIRTAGLIMGRGAQAVDHARRLVDEGYESIKVKVGRTNVGEEARTVLEVRQAVGSRIELRLDANRAWELRQAIEFITATTGAQPSFIEEPVANLADAKRLWEETGVNIALDETLREIEPEELRQWPFISHLVLKPTLMGGITASSPFIAVASGLDMTPVVSSAFESGLATAFLACLTACWCGDRLAAGLDTYSRLETDVLTKRLALGPIVDLADLCFEPTSSFEGS